MNAFYYRKGRFYWGVIRHVVEDRIQICTSNGLGKDDTFRNFEVADEMWNFAGKTPRGIPSSETTPRTTGPRCKRTRTGIHPATGEPIQLQCVVKGMHSTCHYENPSNEQVKSNE